ncbi:hypothetical protein HKD37_18G049238 [Glycine soja]
MSVVLDGEDVGIDECIGDDMLNEIDKFHNSDEDIETQGPTQGLGGPMTRARVKKPKETLKQVVATILEVALAVKDIEPKLFQCMIWLTALSKPIRTYQGLSITLMVSSFNLSFITGSDTLHLSSNES